MSFSLRFIIAFPLLLDYSLTDPANFLGEDYFLQSPLISAVVVKFIALTYFKSKVAVRLDGLYCFYSAYALELALREESERLERRFFSGDS